MGIGFKRRAWVMMALATLIMAPGVAGGALQSDAACLQVEHAFVTVDTAHSVAAADVNQDGHLDLVVVAHFPVRPEQAGAVFLGDGAGGFTLFEHLFIGEHNHGIILIDLNHDGHLDLVTSTAAIQTPQVEINVVHTFLGDGTGRFPRHDAWPVQRDRLGPLDVQVADLSNDGNLDLVVTGAGIGHVAVLVGDGTGRFERPRFFSNILTRTRSAAIADFNQDGNLDVVTTNRYGNSVSLFLGDGAGSLEFSKRFYTGLGPRSVAAADLNGDGQLDLAVTCREPDLVSVLLGDGPGEFARAQNTSVGGDPRTIVAEDLNADGVLDLAITNAKSQTVSLLFGDAKGGFSSRQDVPVGEGPVGGTGPPSEGEGNGLVGLCAADLNEDGRPDLLVTSTYDDRVYVLMNRCQE